jgi:hypothetical protein
MFIAVDYRLCYAKSFRRFHLRHIFRIFLNSKHNKALIHFRFFTKLLAFQKKENTTLPLLRKQLAEIKCKTDNVLKVIEDGIFNETTSILAS